ncbi:hypothetical protein R3P38DRAFT_2766337 [Favolaschia claudopus]|uniref:Uncharacterized protein n=1 Tax=Favolaschia claudopus TaxID=2862362 RepID=A0AAW0D1C9_9AGAR
MPLNVQRRPQGRNCDGASRSGYLGLPLPFDALNVPRCRGASVPGISDFPHKPLKTLFGTTVTLKTTASDPILELFWKLPTTVKLHRGSGPSWKVVFAVAPVFGREKEKEGSKKERDCLRGRQISALHALQATVYVFLAPRVLIQLLRSLLHRSSRFVLGREVAGRSTTANQGRDIGPTRSPSGWAVATG